MDGIFQAALIIHILFGSVALFVAPAAMVTSKGGLWHRRWGKFFFWAITGVAITAVVMSLIRSGLFFLLVALFSFYLAFTGYRVLYRKTPQQRATQGDWIAVSAMLAGSVALLAYGAYLMLTSSFGMVALVFGALGLLFAIRDIHEFRHFPADKQAWWYSHMTRMLAAYIATVTAFSVVNFRFLPPLTRWLWATVVGTAGIIIWTRYYRKKFDRRPTETAVSDLGTVSPR
ncbi:MAG TPA: DUF2306 domain-containing protein [Chthoniobacterales bacterium]|nr:DUF2306 domain-containing protein [Chthoniobacterales bacterium]